MSFSKFIFSTGIELFIRNPVALFGILILSDQFDGFVQLLHGEFFKTDSCVFINTWNTEFYIPLLLKQNKSRYKYDID